MLGASKKLSGEIEIRRIQTIDVPSLALLMAEMQAHYRVPCPPLPEIESFISNRPPGNDIFVAAYFGKVVAFSAFSAIFPGPRLRPGLFLKELYVDKAFRSNRDRSETAM